MALVREGSPDELCLNLLHDSEGPLDVLGRSNIQSSLLSPTLHYGAGRLKEGAIDERASSDTTSEVTKSPNCAPYSFNSAGVILQEDTSRHAGSNKPVINFKHGYSNFLQASAGALLSFQQNEQDEQLGWEGNLNNIYQWTNYSPRSCDGGDPSLMENFSCLQKAADHNTMFNVGKERQNSDGSGNWFYSEASAITDSSHDFGTHEPSTQKRAFMGYSTEASKKQCLGTNKKTKPKSSATKDPQSIAAKNRRERISERLKTLQELVPNGSKVDLVTMLEKAISYVKFLQLQVKILATDEFWPVQGGKAPDISQVKEAIDAILSSQRDRNSSSSKS